MGLDLQQRITRVQQKINAKEAAGHNTAGLQKKLAKLLRRLGVANTVAGAALTLGIASFVLPSGDAPSGGSDIAASSGSSVVGSETGGGLVWGVTIGGEALSPGEPSTDNAGTSSSDLASSTTPTDPEVAPPENGNSDGSSTGTDAGLNSGDVTDAAGQTPPHGGSGSTGAPDSNDSTADPVTEEGIE